MRNPRERFVWRPGLVPGDLKVAARDWATPPSWVATDQIAAVDVQLGARRHLATLVSEGKELDVADSIRMMLALHSVEL